VSVLDPCSTLATALKGIFNADSIISAYNWQEWESDAVIAQPRAYINVTMQTDTPMTQSNLPFRFQFEIVFEGKPKAGSPSDAVAEVLGQVQRPTLGTALMAAIPDNSITITGKAEQVIYRQAREGDLRKRTIVFFMYGNWNVQYTP
jgi:hypothetical protein